MSELHRVLPQVCLVALVLGAATAWAAPTASIELAAPDREYRNCPVTVEVTAPDDARSAVLTDAAGKPVAGQLWRRDDRTLLTFIVAALPKGGSIAYKVAFGAEEAAAPQGVTVRKSDNGPEVLIGEALFTRYDMKNGPKPYLYPVIGPTGAGVTRNFPMKTGTPNERTDHPHHRSFWFTHDKVNGVDFWLEGARGGKQIHRAFEALESGPVMGRIRAVTDWVAPDGRKVLEDVRDIRVYNIDGARLFDWDTTARASEGPVTFGDTKEGTFGCRVAGTMKVDAKMGGAIVNSEGQKDGDAWGRPAKWVDYTGPVEEKTVGIAMLNHPTSFRHPTHWHVRTYGLFAANPFGLHDFPDGKGKDGSHTIPAGGTMPFVFRVYIHPGTTDVANVASVYEQYANPPKAVVK